MLNNLIYCIIPLVFASVQETTLGAQYLIDSNLKNMKLDLRGKKIGSKKLEEIFAVLTTAYQDKVTSINLSFNTFIKISLDSFKPMIDLQELSISNNKITEIETSSFKDHFPNLKTLVLSNNLIKSFPNGLIDKCVLLETFEIENNKLTSISNKMIGTFLKLKQLNMSNNQIKTIEEGSFNGISNLSDINLKGNSIENLPDNLFNNFKELTEINLSFNDLTVEPCFDQGVLSTLTGLKLAGNGDMVNPRDYKNNEEINMAYVKVNQTKNFLKFQNRIENCDHFNRSNKIFNTLVAGGVLSTMAYQFYNAYLENVCNQEGNTCVSDASKWRENLIRGHLNTTSF